MKDSIQGSYTIEQEDNILFIEAVGPFNEGLIKQYAEDVLSIGKSSQQPWGTLVTYRGNGIFTPEAEELLISFTQTRIKHGMVANASVILHSNLADLQQMQLRRIYNYCKLPFYVFSDIHSAKSWLSDFISDQRAAS